MTATAFGSSPIAESATIDAALRRLRSNARRDYRRGLISLRESRALCRVASETLDGRGALADRIANELACPCCGIAGMLGIDAMRCKGCRATGGDR